MASFKNESNRNQTTLIVVGTATVTIVATTAVYCWWKMQIQRKRNRQIIGNKGADVENNNMDPLLSVTTKTANTKIIYLDYNGTTPVYPEIVQAMVPFFQTHFGNPGSRHVLGDVPRQAIQRARQQILVDLLGAATATLESSSVSKDSMDSMYSSILFTACGTESDNLMIHLALQQQYSKKSSAANIPHIVTSNVEHPAIDACLRHYESIGRCTVTFVPVQTDGRVSVKDMIAAIRPNT
jgi:selenocysteine lyase/cysteine desulfurase